MLSTESKKGSPRPAGRPIMAVSKIPPNESPSVAFRFLESSDL